MLLRATRRPGPPAWSCSPHAPGGVVPAGRDVMLAWRLPLFVVVSLTLGLLSHVGAAGPAESVPGLVVAAGALVATWCRLAGREQSRTRLVLLVWASQLEVHLALTVTADPMSHAAPMPGPGGPAGARMVAAHALAGLLVALWLRRGEALAWRVVRRLGRLLAVRPPVVAHAGPDGGTVAASASPSPRRTRWTTSDPWRGPPCGLPVGA